MDCTVGLGGHAAALLEAGPEIRLIGIDRDRQALAVASERLEIYGDRVRLVMGEFAELKDLLEQDGVYRRLYDLQFVA